MNKRHLEDLELVKKVFDKYNVRFFIVYGLLLGIYRDGDELPGDDDIDLVVIDKMDLETRKKLGWMLVDLGFLPQDMWFNVFERMEQNEIGYNGTEDSGIIVCQRNFKFTIFFMKEFDCDIHKKEYSCIPRLGSKKLISIPSRFFEKSDTIKIGRNKYLTPAPIKDFLSFAYEDWKDKKKRDHSPLHHETHPRDPQRS